MKVGRILTSKGLILYYSATGNTKASVDMFSDTLFDKVNTRHDTDSFNLNNYKYIVIATSTWGRGVPPKPFFTLRDKLANLKDKYIVLIGSGRSDFEFFCGALDLLEHITKDKNKILFKYKYEGYPTDVVFRDLRKLVKGVEENINSRNEI